MNKSQKTNHDLEKINEVYNVMNWPLFVYLDLVLLSTFLGFLLYSQMHVWLAPIMISIVFFLFFVFIFHLFFKDKPDH